MTRTDSSKSKILAASLGNTCPLIAAKGKLTTMFLLWIARDGV